MYFHSRKCIWKYRLENGGNFVKWVNSLVWHKHCCYRIRTNSSVKHIFVVPYEQLIILFICHWHTVCISYRVISSRYIMMTSSNGNIFRVTDPLWSPVNSPHKGKWRGASMFSSICVWISGWVNNGDAGELRHHRAHYDAIVMIRLIQGQSRECTHVMRTS